MLSASPWQESRGDGEHGESRRHVGREGCRLGDTVLCGIRQREDKSFPCHVPCRSWKAPQLQKKDLGRANTCEGSHLKVKPVGD